MTDAPFAHFAPALAAPSPLRRAITDATRRAEADCIAKLIEAATAPEAMQPAIAQTACALVSALRAKGQRGGVESLVKEYALSSQEGVALMCLAEALLRIPDNATRDALIRDKIARGQWQAHLGAGRKLFVNAATWGLIVTGRLVGANSDGSLGAALTRLIARAGEPLIRRGVDLAMELMGEQFVTGETIEEALKRARRLEAQGFAYSYDMLGEAATTAADAERYWRDYENALHAIGKAAAARGPYAGPGISIKLSALHPRYARAQQDRVMGELLPRVRALAILARDYDIGLNIDAEEAERLEISLDILEALALDPDLAGWNGLGFVVQAYGKRCPHVIDWIIDLARRTQQTANRRIMVRLVKGAYWDSEIKKAQVDGQADFPVFTRKVHTDVSYIACARRLLEACDAVFPQFATHNAQTLATIYHLAGPDFTPGDWEFQCLHGMGEPLYEEVVGAGKLNRPCRIYAPVGTHETLLAYLVRRLLENGANSSFVHRIWEESLSPEDLAQAPAQEALAIEPFGSPHPVVALPAHLYGQRRNSAGLDLASESALVALSRDLQASAGREWRADPMIPGLSVIRPPQDLRNPADRRDLVGRVSLTLERDVPLAFANARRAAQGWREMPPAQRAAMLERAADLLEEQAGLLLGLIIREAGKSAGNAVAEIREAVDFLRYYADQARATLNEAHTPIGPVVCISPWNFPLAIFVGQIAAALAAGNPVLAKPAEETPLIAAQVAQILHQAGVPMGVLQLLTGAGEIGAALVAHPDVAGVLFTGSTQVAKLIQRELARHDGPPIPLVAETGGLNAMIVDSSALAEQVTGDVLSSAFDSAGQRCSALRILCLQEDIAERQLTMLKGALGELRIGNPDRLSTDIGPVITEEAREAIAAHIERLRASGCPVWQAPLGEETGHGSFIAPTIIEIESIDQIGGEVFGPVLHVLRYAREDLGAVVEAINATGYGLTFGLHTRLDETIAEVTGRIAAGNIYVNRNTIGAVVGVQPFGGRGLSGTGPKAGGPLYLGRLVRERPALDLPPDGTAELPGPVGERNLYRLHPRGRVLAAAHSQEGMAAQMAAAHAAGNQVDLLWLGEGPAPVGAIAALPRINPYGAVLIKPGPNTNALMQQIAAMEGPIPLIQQGDDQGHYRPDWLVEEQTVSINTTAAGGNAALMAQV
ncbi:MULTISPECIES: bifunctional proline dehydrogenase/L-glutamate gamma-semialdehyde dehydrogenase PutA [unclassified Novosphingobium]|uniref:bifunctional proline dehydrogenase/L-glutamate gamma-semialdehyde dehydrogenase PutA n=1 Tax=unclassified Novosphingobium TaxID=2644732 RepID=UPI00086D2C1A|nr:MULTISPECIES: bifunctional proline dehydrogenase/L-glutamate gamma-semialdehyde dehydrogenase PutA [unclassified Novosphingobium]MBN9145424.1 bifunctional proline dehydrogenase/L-glutamate gamma-semialdehyde dehydrogenase PutA [Novosphingobium sp.]MDR6709835.1 RHH-type proline utilization regulon transcriptional repressor/proline dehydrogenase/delta 1-pyrroline-5-carboxylate dehydrogenase [Novosphingobium sp. 1748]ODU83115.1 MAG: trifunctional transcriptional regulator/proline dehydrogenase/L